MWVTEDDLDRYYTARQRVNRFVALVAGRVEPNFY